MNFKRSGVLVNRAAVGMVRRGMVNVVKCFALDDFFNEIVDAVCGEELCHGAGKQQQWYRAGAGAQHAENITSFLRAVSLRFFAALQASFC